jgi:predicted enzyme related to lactoylglutathione lyase
MVASWRKTMNVKTKRKMKKAMTSIGVSIDVPNLADGVRFYSEAFGFSKTFEPVPGVAMMNLGTSTLCLLEKSSGSKPFPKATDVRRYERHWTPVHLDIHVEDLAKARKRAVQAGAIEEQVFMNPEHGSSAFCSDPFGHGFCLIERRL